MSPAKAPAIALLPQRESLDGPLTAARLRRTLIGYLLLAGAGFALALSGGGFWQSFGLGLVMPGGGFFSHFAGGFGAMLGYGLLFLFSLLLFFLGLFAWFGSGNILAPIVVWLGMAVLAGALAPAQPWRGAPVLLAVLIAAAGLNTWRSRRRAYAEALANRSRRNEKLQSIAVKLVTAPTAGLPPVNELSEEALGFLRHVLDRALQPLDSYEGITWVDQFQFAALRYALCTFGYALAGVHYGSLPAFRGYMSQAQQNLHQKMLHHRNWKYWALENAWGNLSLDPNPVPRDNIMYSGWYAAMLAEYISNTGDSRYNDAPLVLRHPDGREWRYTFSELAEAVYRNFKSSDFTLFPCEPNWIYPICNNFGSIAIKIHDRVYGTRWWSEIEPTYRRKFDDEFVTLDGRVLAIRSSKTGLTVGSLTSAMADCVAANYLHGVLPDVARRSWEIARLDFIKLADGKVEIATKGWDNMDTGSYRKSMITTYTQIGVAAAEMGDTEVAELLRQRVRDEFRIRNDDGVRTVEGASSQAHGVILCLFSAAPDLRYNLDHTGMPAARRDGPLLLDAPYPDVMVARADNADGSLRCVLRPGRAGGGEYALGLGQLRPGASYRCEGLLQEGVTADASGQAQVRVRLTGRQEIRVAPLQ